MALHVVVLQHHHGDVVMVMADDSIHSDGKRSSLSEDFPLRTV